MGLPLPLQRLSNKGQQLAAMPWAMVYLPISCITRPGCIQMTLLPSHCLNARTDICLPPAALIEQYTLWTTSKVPGSADYMLEQVRN